MPTRIFCIMCKLKLWYLTILWKTRWVGWGGAQAVLEIQVEGGGQKNVPSIGGLDFFWNNPISTHLYQSSSPFKKKLKWARRELVIIFFNCPICFLSTEPFAQLRC